MVSIRIPLVSKPIRYGAVVILALFILFLSVQQPGEATTQYYGPFGVFRRDKWSHAIGYAMLTATIAYAIVAPVSSMPTERRRRLALTVCLVITFGICLELIQWIIPYRTASWLDAGANTVGSCLLAAFWWWIGTNIRFDESSTISG
jgi:VanZ family protein